MISHGAGIDSIQIEYDRNGTSVWSDKRGGNGGANIDKVSFLIWLNINCNSGILNFCDFVHYFAGQIGVS